VYLFVIRNLPAMAKYNRSKRVEALTLFDCGWSYSLIAKHVNVPLPTIKRWMRNAKRDRKQMLSGKRRANPGNPSSRRTEPPLTDRNRKKIVASIQQNPKRSLRKTARQLKVTSRLTVSKSTLSLIAASADLEPGHRARKPFLSPEDQERREAWAIAHKPDDWSSTVVVDELDVDLNGSPNLHNQVYWHKRGTPVPSIPTRKFPVSRHYFMACSARGAIDPIPIEPHPTSASYTQMLDSKFVPAVNRLFEGDYWRLYQDLAPWHTSGTTQSYCADHMPDFLTKDDTPPRSPDTSPQESINAEIQQAIADAEPSNAAELETAFFAAFRAATTQEKLAKLFASMPQRLQAVIDAKGKMTRY
jgi:hypothetical protein